MEKSIPFPSKSQRIKQAIKKRCQIKPPVTSDPRLFHPRAKSGIIACIALVATAGGFSSTIYFPGLPYITRDLNATPIATTLTAALFILFSGIAPVVWASLSEYYHLRRFIYLVAMVIFMATSVAAACINNIWALVAVRCIQSIGVSSGMAVGAGYISDLYPIEERGAAFGKFIFGVVFGPLLGPILGGFLIMSAAGWRATFWFCFAFGALIFCVTFLFLPETFRETSWDKPEELPLHGVRVEEEGKKKFFNPFAAFELLKHPFILLSSVSTGFFFGAMFATETILPNAFKNKYGLNSWQVGLSYLGAGIGNLSGSMLGGRLSDRLLLAARARRGEGAPHVAEDRLTMNLWFAGFLFNPLGLLIFGWVVERELSFWGAIVAFGVQCFGNVQFVTTVTAYLVDAVPGRGAAVTAVANFVRFTFACILTLISTPMTEGLGAGWTSTLFACLSWLGISIMLVLKIWGHRMRAWSGF
ncbi:hypothetical protein INT47_008537 [Mucor saturninus]|uniref:Major facilitator superfamily (MFS) profile domain-containing protein n=1 Tax=Mucor saturninus TaxID=64648 RepID=A0A8H7RA59_9FUNG|nr:hypothetical protein INT47_008537 [Mucor saturninus]